MDSLKLMKDKLLEIKGDNSFEVWSDQIKAKTGEYISPSSLHKYTQLKRMPPIDVLEIIAKSANIEVQDFFSGFNIEKEGEFRELLKQIAEGLREDNELRNQLVHFAGTGKTESIISILKHQLAHYSIEKSLFTTNESPNKYKTQPTIHQIPIIGFVPAGGPVIVDENLEGHMPLPENLVKSPDDFCLRVRGDSMEEVDINDGDIVLVHPQPTAENGQTIIARINGAVTCKRFYRMNGKCRLEPANAKYKPIDCEELEIIGIVIKVIKEVF